MGAGLADVGYISGKIDNSFTKTPWGKFRQRCIKRHSHARGLRHAIEAICYVTGQSIARIQP
jgi:hypothetical protein